MSDVDPRFDPVFQRGYDPDRHGAAARVEPVAERPAPVEVPAFARPSAGPAVPLSTARPTSTAQGNGIAADREEAREDVDAEPGVNPWRLALLVASLAVLVLAGLFLFWVADGSFNSSGSQSDVMTNVIQNLSYQAPPALLIGGFSGLALWLALGALGRRR